MKRSALKLGAILGAAVVSTLAVAPAFAAAATSQATAQSLHIAIAGTDAISQKVTATNNGSGQAKNNADTIPNLASLLPANNLIGAGVAPQDAFANSDGTSFACAGIAGTGAGIVKVGNSSCNIDGKPLTIDLAHLNLGNVVSDAGALNPILSQFNFAAVLLNQIITNVSGALNGTPLGQIAVGGSLSAIEASCVADPDKASGTAHIVDTTGGSNATPIGVTIPNGTGGTQNLALVNLPANPPPNTHVLVGLSTVTQTLVTALTQEFNTAVGGALAPLNLGNLLQNVQDAIVTGLVANLQPLLQPLQANILDITLNKQSTGDNGRSIDVTALDAQVLPAAAQFTGGKSLISGQIGEVTCGPNTRATTTPATPAPTPKHPKNPHVPSVPNVVDSGLAGHQDHTARNVLGATAALMLLAGTAGLMGYRRMLNK